MSTHLSSSYQPSRPAIRVFVSLALGLTGVFCPSPNLLSVLGISLTGSADGQLLLGAALFRVGLVILGLSMWVIGWVVPTRNAALTVEPSRKHDKGALALLCIILTVAAVLRLYRLDEGLWHDEILTYTRYAKIPFGQIISTFHDQNQHLLYSVLARASFLVFGENAWALRLPAVLFGIGSIAALYLFSRETAGTLKALLASALLALSYHHVWFSQNARGYTGLLFWTLVASWILLLAMRRGETGLWIWYAVATALGVFTNMTMLFVTAGHFSYFLTKELRKEELDRRTLMAGTLSGFLLAGVLTFQLHALVLPQLLLGLGEESTVPLWKTTGWALIEFARGVGIGFSSGLVAAGALLLFGAGLVKFWREEPAVIAFFLVPALLGSGVIIALGHHLWPRFFFFSFGFAGLILTGGCLLLGRIAGAWVHLSPRVSQTLGVSLCLALVLASAVSVPAAFAPKQDFEAALEFVKAGTRPGDAVVTVGLASFTFDHYYRTGWTKVENLDELKAIRSAANRTWLLYTFKTHVRSVYPEVWSAIEAEFRVISRFEGTVGDGTVFVCLAERSD